MQIKGIKVEWTHTFEHHCIQQLERSTLSGMGYNTQQVQVVQPQVVFDLHHHHHHNAIIQTLHQP